MFICSLLITYLFSLTNSKITVTGEWIEIPQTSDGSKFSNFLFNKHFHKLSFHEYNDVPSFALQNVSNFEKFGKMKTKVSGQNVNYEVSIDSSTYKSTIASKIFSTIQYPRIIYECQDKIMQNDDEVKQTDVESPTISFSVPKISRGTEFAIRIPNSTNILKNTTKTAKCQNGTTIENETLFEYAPSEMLSEIHQKLKSQPLTYNTKIRFLKQFEKKLLAEIGTQLAVTTASTRRIRGTSVHYEHGYSETDNADIGFPSYEGALMTISFLIFAVYLIKLVMSLLRNSNNTAPILLGREERSVDNFVNDTLVILDYLETFTAN